MRTDITKEQIKALLLQAQEAHHAYERNLDGSDPDWAGWYAEFMFSRLDELQGAEGTSAAS